MSFGTEFWLTVLSPTDSTTRDGLSLGDGHTHIVPSRPPTEREVSVTLDGDPEGKGKSRGVGRKKYNLDKDGEGEAERETDRESSFVWTVEVTDEGPEWFN